MATEINSFQYEQTHDSKLRESICVAATVKVLAFDPAKMTVNVQPLSKHLEHGNYESQPPILRVPVMCMKTGGFIVRPWINAGDVGLVVYLDHVTERNHSTSDAVFIGGIVSGNYSASNLPANALVLASEGGGSFIEITDGYIRINAPKVYINE